MPGITKVRSPSALPEQRVFSLEGKLLVLRRAEWLLSWVLVLRLSPKCLELQTLLVHQFIDRKKALSLQRVGLLSSITEFP